MKVQTSTEIKMMFEALRNDIERSLEKMDRLMYQLIIKDDE